VSNFVSYNSSAGSGKTFTLVKEYLKIALESDDANQYRKVLAITFTNKAAAEMKERILDALKALSSGAKLEGTPKFLLEELIQPKADGGLEISPEQIQVRASRVLKSILHNYNDFGISTIDKFTHKIIRTFAHDLQLPLNFNVELEEEDVLKASIDMLITEVGNNEKLTRLLVDYALQKSDDEQSWSVEKDLLDFSKKLLKDDGELHLENVRQLSITDFEDIKKELYKQIKSFESTVKTLGKEGVAFINAVGINPDSFNRSYFYKYWEDLKTFNKVSVNDTVLKMIDGSKEWYAKSKPEQQKALIEENKSKLIELFNQSRAYIDEYEGKYIVIKQLVSNLYNLAVVNEIEKTLVEFKQENNILNISDFNKRIAKIVASEPVPFIYERLGEKYQHYLIDEFQDTSIIQWHNLLPLVDNSLANGKFNMVVGDAKQAIYRWRGGEVEQIINFPKVYKHDNNPLLLEREASIDRNFKEESLKNNYRSKAEIVEFNNQFFQFVSVNLSDKYKQLYASLEQGFNKENTGGGVTIDFVEEDKEANLVAIRNLIQQSVKDGYKFSDIAILTRGKEAGKEIAVDLLDNNIQVISAESLLLNNSKEVNFILDFLRYIALPSDKNFMTKVLTYLTQEVYDDDLFEVISKKEAVPIYLKEKEIDIQYGRIQKYSLYELVEYLFGAFSMDRSIDIYLQFLLDKVHEYASRNDNSILNFIEWWEQKSHNFSIVIPEGIDAVQVMTIHKSKGLEFPVVIYPFANSTVKRGEDFFWTDDTGIEGLKSAIIPIKKELEQTKYASIFELEMDKSKLDLINLMYVAFTRPKDRLHVLTKRLKKTSENGSIPDYLMAFCEDNESNRIDDNQYKFGELLANRNQPVDAPKNIRLSTSVYNSWREKIQISYQAPKVWEVDKPESIGEHGTLIHNILSKIERIEDLENSLQSFLLQGVVNEEEMKEISKMIVEMFEQPSIKNLFVDFDELKNERAILLPNGDTYKPDRVVVKANTTYLVDYKTGEREAKHQQQIKDYRNLLAEMGYRNIKPQLMYVKEGIVVDVD
jgi:ATP-dependent exoDNAse (exonuclease V) beta subunit